MSQQHSPLTRLTDAERSYAFDVLRSINQPILRRALASDMRKHLVDVVRAAPPIRGMIADTGKHTLQRLVDDALLTFLKERKLDSNEWLKDLKFTITLNDDELHLNPGVTWHVLFNGLGEVDLFQPTDEELVKMWSEHKATIIQRITPS